MVKHGLMRRLVWVACAMGFIGLVPSVVKANSVEVTFAGLSGGPGAWDWHYALTLTPDNYVSTGDFVALFDFDGFAAAGSIWSFMASPPLSGPDYTLVSADDSPVEPTAPVVGGPFPGQTPPAGDLGIPDLLFRYSGLSPYLISAGPLPPPGSAPGDLLLGELIVRSVFATGALDVVASSDTSTGPNKVIGGGDDVPNTNVRITTVPRNGGFLVAPLPIPALAGSLLLSWVGIKRKKKGDQIA